MPIPTYTPGYPPDGSSLGQTKATIRNNLDGTFETLGVDHINNNGAPGSQPAGYHTLVHQVSQTSVSTLTNYNQIFSGIPGTLVVNSNTTPSIPSNGDTQLYSLSSAGVLSQLTGNVANANGYVWVGGILFQWGTIASTSSNPSVSFSPAFPNNLFSVQVTRTHNNTSPGSSFSYWVNTASYTNTGFQIINNDGHTWSYNWLAIGN